MFYFFLLVVGVLGIGIYVLFIFSQVPGAKEERLGVLEPLPSDLGKWLSDEASAEGTAAASEGLRREVRTLRQEREMLKKAAACFAKESDVIR